MYSAERIVAEIDRLIAMPTVYLRVREIIGSPDGSIHDLARVLCHDVAMSARVLRIANSPLFGMTRRIDTITRALNILGMQQVHDLVLSWVISASCGGVQPQGLDIAEFWKGSVRRALASRQLAVENGFLDANRLFVEGLLSDIGHLVLHSRVPTLATAARDAHRDSGRPLHQVEREEIGCDYADVGAALVRAWKLPEAFFEPILLQNAPSSAANQRMEAAILHVAGIVAAQPLGRAPAIRTLDTLAAEMLELDDASLGKLAETTARDMDNVLATFFPQIAQAA